MNKQIGFLLGMSVACQEPIPQTGSMPEQSTGHTEQRPPIHRPQNAPESPDNSSNPEHRDMPHGEGDDRIPQMANFGCSVTPFWMETLYEGRSLTMDVSLKGDIEQGLPLLIDVISQTENKAVFGVECSMSESLQIELPQNLGEVWFFAFVDTGGDGPSKEDRQARSEIVTLGDSALPESVELQLKAETIVEAFSLNPPAGATIVAPVVSPSNPKEPEEENPQSN